MSNHVLMDHNKAEELAKSLKSDDPEWDYKAVPCAEGSSDKGTLSCIEVYDETGVLLGRL